MRTRIALFKKRSSRVSELFTSPADDRLDACGKNTLARARARARARDI